MRKAYELPIKKPADSHRMLLKDRKAGDLERGKITKQQHGKSITPKSQSSAPFLQKLIHNVTKFGKVCSFAAAILVVSGHPNGIKNFGQDEIARKWWAMVQVITRSSLKQTDECQHTCQSLKLQLYSIQQWIFIR